jgi:hypothetical protein
MNRPTLVIIESPFAGDIEVNKRYLQRCIRDCVSRGESPYASHGLLTQQGVLDDNKACERQLGIELGFAWLEVADKTVVYRDHGISSGMKLGIKRAKQLGKAIEYREIGG